MMDDDHLARARGGAESVAPCAVLQIESGNIYCPAPRVESGNIICPAAGLTAGRG